MCALGIQERSGVVRVTRALTRTAEHRPIVLIGISFLCGVASVAAGYGLVRIGRWFVFGIKRKPFLEEQQNLRTRHLTNYECPPSESTRIVQNVGQNRRDAEPENRIRLRAYQLYEARGSVDGDDWQDWFNAEREIFET
jgi:hypothetical protein